MSDRSEHVRRHWSFWCWLFGCDIHEVNGDHWCGRCGRDRYFENGFLKARPPLAPGEQPPRKEPQMGDEQIKHMVSRFLSWRLPKNFNPDCGISFKPDFNEHTAWPMKHEPVGTNLFDATQAEEMIRYLVDGLPPAPPVQERESDEMRKLALAAARTYVKSRGIGDTISPSLVDAFYDIAATAANQAREGAVRWLLYVGGVDHETLLDILKGDTLAADGDVDVNAEFADLQRALAAQPKQQKGTT